VSSEALFWAVVALALAFDFTNGFHDTANAVATSVSTRALSPRTAVLVASTMNFAGAFSSTAVATTIGTGIVAGGAGLHQEVVLAGLTGAIAWNLLTWYLGLPSSSSYALIGGLIGGALVANGSDGVAWSQIARQVLAPAVVAPLAGFALAFALLVAVLWLGRAARPSNANRALRLGQVGMGALMAFAHGTNDAQKTMGVIGLALLADGRTSHFQIPVWVIVSSAAALALGTYAGGWRIMRTLGFRIFRIEPAHGFAAQTSASVVLLGTAAVGLPVSTTQVITGAVFGAGSGARAHVRWSLAAEILVVWILTLPAAAAFAAIIYLPVRIF